MGKDKFEFARIASPEEIAEYLTSLADGLKRGELRLESGERVLHLTPPAELKLELRVKDKEDKGKIGIELAWKRRAAARASGLRVGIAARTRA